MQSDLVKEIRIAHWQDGPNQFQKAYTNAIIISNTCDISFDNKRNLNVKQCLFAPLLDFNMYLKELSDAGYEKENIDKNP